MGFIENGIDKFEDIEFTIYADIVLNVFLVNFFGITDSDDGLIQLIRYFLEILTKIVSD